MSPLAAVVVVVVMLTAAGAVGGGLPDAAEVGGNAWRSADAMHPIQSIPSYCSTMPRRGSETSHVGWLFNTEAHLFPNTAEWWGPLSETTFFLDNNDTILWGTGGVPLFFSGDDRVGCYILGESYNVGAAVDLHLQRLSVIDELLRGLDAASDANHKEDAEADVFPHRFYCANHAISDIERISRSIFR
ncbi:putative mannosyl-oligosaccharide 1,2-alpha-mannosidase IB [Trypanosoma theileri]|uniref:Putative mannosyl-oligosaccharide 1,2-alpha-mannosidase IB n=1 Tax=Trypanosoma theileri TaxID=67003 RepID=A0A1X0NY78_9TRYP|nr:putative mannosyl-oligosaccharide 1,2-alpha-mannosidase IB [Trypanosoma theileri]ORC89179.1 putative mannosyl-oligosaccharide 1,2-alpha-mannosidase IB [Trypanosoma theileri]